MVWTFFIGCVTYEFEMREITEIKEMQEGDLTGASNVHREVFERQMNSFEWLSCNLNAYPRILCYVAKDKESIVGYIMWTQKSGFRHQAIIELEQIAVTPIHQGKGIGQALIERTLPLVKQVLECNGSHVKHIIVTTRADNHAQQLYRKTLGAEVEATIPQLYSADEVVMIARNV